MLADVEAEATDAAVADLSPSGPVSGHQVDITDEDAVAAPRRRRLRRPRARRPPLQQRRRHLGGGGKLWQQEPNDWRWCFGVNVFGMAICTSAFVPRMIDGGRPGQVVNTSSGDGGFAPVPMASVYAASKAAVSCFTESLHCNLESEGTRAAGLGLLPVGRVAADGAVHRHPQPAGAPRSAGPRHGAVEHELRRDEGDARRGAGATSPGADLDELGDFAVTEAAARRYLIARDLDHTVELLHRRADAIRRREVPPHHGMPL